MKETIIWLTSVMLLLQYGMDALVEQETLLKWQEIMEKKLELLTLLIHVKSIHI